jgi:alkylation response protein AidB-like acyl-CoA dehydrogenase
MYRLSPQQQELAARAGAIADDKIAPHAARSDQNAEFVRPGITALAEQGYLGLTVASEFGGLGQGLRTASAVLEEIAQRDASTAMVYLMHLCGIACYSAAPGKTSTLLRQAAAGKHLSTLAFSETGSRSHFWAPVSKAAVENGRTRVNAKKSFVTSAGQADGYVVSTGDANGSQPIESTIYYVLAGDAGVASNGSWSGLGMRGNSSAPMTFEVLVDADRALTQSGKGLDMMLGIVLPLFQVGSAAIGVGIAEASVRATQGHLTASRFEHQGKTLAELPTLRARLAEMRIETDKARAHLGAVLDSLESPGPMTQLLVLEAKAAATEAAVRVTDLAMRTCGGAAFGGALGLERRFRDARAPIIMAPTTDQAYDFIGRALCGLELLA